jgi:hypothetical protein
MGQYQPRVNVGYPSMKLLIDLSDSGPHPTMRGMGAAAVMVQGGAGQAVAIGLGGDGVGWLWGVMRPSRSFDASDCFVKADTHVGIKRLNSP